MELVEALAEERQELTLEVVESAALESRQRKKGLSGIIPFTAFTFPTFAVSWHHYLIGRFLDRIARGKIKRGMIFAPPRHSKSELASIRFPAYYLGLNPQHAIIGASYAENLAKSLSRACRDTVDGPAYRKLFPKVRLSLTGDVRWQLEGKLDHRPSFIAAGIGGSISGEGANGLIIDDPIKNAKQAYSKVYRDDCHEWYTMVARTRLQPGGWIVLMMTRWHEDDLAGRLLKAEREQWTVLTLPAVNPEGKYELKPYKALWLSRYGVDALASLRRDVGPIGWGALYQQDPQTATGSIFKREWFRPYKRTDVPQFEDIIQIWDTAFEAGQENDYSACVTLGRVQDRVYVIRVWRDRVQWPDLLRRARREAELVEQGYRQPVTRVIIENKGSGISLRQALQADPTFRWPVFPIEALLKKRVRATQVSGYPEAGQVHVLADQEWTPGFIDELCEFDKGMHDDQVDAFVHGLTFYAAAGQDTTESVVSYEENVVISPELDDLEQRLGL
jgi:predicted phage terminase large subunit-like protein